MKFPHSLKFFEIPDYVRRPAGLFDADCKLGALEEIRFQLLPAHWPRKGQQRGDLRRVHYGERPPTDQQRGNHRGPGLHIPALTLSSIDRIHRLELDFGPAKELPGRSARSSSGPPEKNRHGHTLSYSQMTRPPSSSTSSRKPLQRPAKRSPTCTSPSKTWSPRGEADGPRNDAGHSPGDFPGPDAHRQVGGGESDRHVPHIGRQDSGALWARRRPHRLPAPAPVFLTSSSTGAARSWLHGSLEAPMRHREVEQHPERHPQ